MNKRTQEIDSTIHKLESFKQDPVYGQHRYAIDENIIFLNAIRTVPTYISWLFKRAKKIDGSKLIELTDFPVEEWDIKMHKKLIEVQRNKHIGLGKSLVDKLISYILSEDRDVVIADLGAGGMEIDRQVISSLLEKKINHSVIIVGIDKSPTTQQIAKENLSSLPGLHIYEVENVNSNTIEKIQKTDKGIIVILAKNNIFELDRDFPNKYFDAAYHSLFKHHLSQVDQNKLDKILESISKNIYEYDGYRTWPVVLPQSLTAWNHPLFLSDTILSFLRYKDKREIIAGPNKISFFNKTGHYLLEIKN